MTRRPPELHESISELEHIVSFCLLLSVHTPLDLIYPCFHCAPCFRIRLLFYLSPICGWLGQPCGRHEARGRASGRATVSASLMWRKKLPCYHATEHAIDAFDEYFATECRIKEAGRRGSRTLALH